MRNKCCILFVCLTLFIFSKGQTADPNFPVTDSFVYAMARNGNTLYIGGNFQFVGQNAPYSAVVNPTNGSVSLSFARPNGFVTASTSDGNGGWYIAGNFSRVGGLPRINIAHIKSDGSVDPWNPSLEWSPYVVGAINCLTLVGNTLYIAGQQNFSVNSTLRKGVAAVDATTGNLLPWFPILDGDVKSLVVANNLVYVAGSFSTINGIARNNIAAIDQAGNPTAWNPNGNGINCMIIVGKTMYVGGYSGFTIGSTIRHGLAAIDTSTGIATSWNPNINKSVLHIASGGNTIVAGTPGDLPPSGIPASVFAVDAISGALIWNRDVFSTTLLSPQINALSVVGGTVYAAGIFTISGSQARYNSAGFDMATGGTASWTSNTSNIVHTLSGTTSAIYIGGQFKVANASARNRIAAIDIPTNSVTPWIVGPFAQNPGATGTVRALTTSGNLVYAGGSFNFMGGQVRSGLAAINAQTGSVTTWNPNVSPTSDFISADGVFAISLSGNLAYIGGHFTSVSRTGRNNLAAVDTTTGFPTSWNPNVNDTVNSIIASGNTIYIGGKFTSIGGMQRNALAAIDSTTGTPTTWISNVTGTIYSLQMTNNSLYAAGVINNSGNKKYLASISTTSGTASSLYPSEDGLIRSIAINNDTIYVGGNDKLVAVGRTNGIIMGQTTVDSSIYTILLNGNTIYAGGAFKNIASAQRGYLASLTLALVPTAINPVISVASSFSIIPKQNPFKNQLNFIVNAVSRKDAFITVTDIMGRTLYNRSAVLNAGENNFAIDLSNQSNGVYILKVVSAKNQVQLKVLKQ